MRGKSDVALDDFRRSAETAPAYPQARMKYGLLLDLHRSSEALVELQAALSCAPADWAPRAEIERVVASIRVALPPARLH